MTVEKSGLREEQQQTVFVCLVSAVCVLWDFEASLLKQKKLLSHSGQIHRLPRPTPSRAPGKVPARSEGRECGIGEWNQIKLESSFFV